MSDPRTNAASEPGARFDGAAALVIAALVIAAYGPLAMAGFAWDDEALVVRNLLTGSLTNLPELFRVDLWVAAGEAPSGYYRPMMLVSLMVDELLWRGADGERWVGGLHLHSVAWHIAASLALLGLLRRLVPPLAAAGGAALFALHPAQSEAVAWIAARNDLMAACFLILSARALLPRDAGPARLLAGGAAALCALLAKENAALGLALLPALDWARWGRLACPRRYGALAAAALIWWSMRAAAGVALEDVSDGVGVQILLERWPDLLAWYSLKLVAPWPLTIGETLEYLDVSGPRMIGGLLVLPTLAMVATRLDGERRRLAWVGLAFGALTFAPALAAIAIRGPIGERYLYTPLIGGALWTGSAAAPLGRRALALWALALPALALIADRVPDWRDGLSLWSAAVMDTPNGHSYASLGHEMNIAGRPEEALQLWRLALEDDPAYIDVCENLVRLPLRKGWPAIAAANAEYGVERRCPQSPDVLGMYASALAQSGRWEEARAAVDAAEGDPSGRAALIGMALSVIDDDRARYEASEASLGAEPAVLEAQVRQILAIGGFEGRWFTSAVDVESETE